jgi:hypothetical protein
MMPSFRAFTPFGRAVFSSRLTQEPCIHIYHARTMSTTPGPTKSSELFNQAMTSPLRQSPGVLHRYQIILQIRLEELVKEYARLKPISDTSGSQPLLTELDSIVKQKELIIARINKIQTITEL